MGKKAPGAVGVLYVSVKILRRKNNVLSSNHTACSTSFDTLTKHATLQEG